MEWIYKPGLTEFGRKAAPGKDQDAGRRVQCRPAFKGKPAPSHDGPIRWPWLSWIAVRSRGVGDDPVATVALGPVERLIGAPQHVLLGIIGAVE